MSPELTEPDFTIPICKIPTERVDRPFAQIINAIQTSTIHGTRKLHEIEIFVVKNYVNASDTALHWAAKLRWDTKHKIPGGQVHARSAKPMGVILACEIELCVQCHAGVGYKTAGYLDASLWFGDIYRESLQVGVTDLLVLTKHEGGKKAQVLYLRRLIAVLENDENPFDVKVMPCLHHLIECSIDLAKRSDLFRKKYWRPYIRSLKAWATQMDLNPRGYYQEQFGRVVQREGRSFFQVCRTINRGKGLRVMFEKELGAKTLAP